MTTFGPAGAKPHKWIRASAGTGKTFQLAARYRALIDNGAAPETILATTFTRAAAAEIRSRVLKDAANDVLANPDNTTACAQLHTLVRALPRLQIRTLDSLYASIVRSVSDLVDVPVDARLVEPGEEEALLHEAIEMAARSADHTKVLQTLATLSAGGNGVRVIAAIDRAVRDVMSLADRTEPSAWTWPLPKCPDAESVAAAAEALKLLSEQEAKVIQGGAKAILDRVEPDGSMRPKACKEILDKKFALGVLGDGLYRNKPIPPVLIAPAREIVTAAIAMNDRNLALRTVAIHDLIRLVRPALKLLKQQRGVVSFDDYVRALDPEDLDFNGDLGELWFRLDGSIQHMLLDEFQDTSWAQWRALQPIVEEVVAYGAGERSLFVVGDLKQSIYGWRGGEPAFLEKLSESCGPEFVNFDALDLAESYRSGQPVIDAVNTVFEEIDSNAAAVGCSPAAAKTFAGWFKHHTTNKKDLGGEVRLEILPEPEDGVHAEDVMAHEAARTAAVLFETAANGEVAVLVRRNKMVGKIVEALRALNVPAAAQGNGSLIDTDAATLIIQALRWAESPLDSLAAYDVARSPLAACIGLESIAANESVSLATCTEVSALLRADLARYGAGTVVDRWRRTMDAHLTDRERGRLRQLVEFFDGLRGQGRTPGGLAALALQDRVEDPAGEGVVVMTIHQAKGMQYDAVVVTDLAQGMGLKGDLLVWESPSPPTEKIQRICVRFDKDAVPDAAVVAHEHATERSVREGFCGLYVSMTRAKRTLIMHVPRPNLAKGKAVHENTSSLCSAAGILREAFARDVSADAFETGVAYEGGTPVSPPSTPRSALVLQHRPTLVLDGAHEARPPRHAAAKGTGRFPSLDLDRCAATERGTAIHAALEDIVWLDEGGVQRATLERAMGRACPRASAADLSSWCGDLERAIATDAVAAVFRKPSDNPRVEREATFIGGSSGGVDSIVIDRLVVAEDGASARVYDFKTNQAGLSETDLLAEYGDQLARYRAFVAASLRIAPEAVALWLVDLDQHVTINASP